MRRERCGIAARHDDRAMTANQIGGQRWQTIKSIVGPAVFNC